MKKPFLASFILCIYCEIMYSSETVGIFIDSGLREAFTPEAFADFNQDGILDIWASQSGSPDTVLFGTKGLEFKESKQLLDIMDSKQVIADDLDNDGDSDIFIIDRNGTACILKNNGSGLFEKFAEYGISASTVSLGDLNGDSFLDAWIALRDGNEIWINNHDATFQLAHTRFASDEETIRIITFGDMDGDSDLDAWVGSGQQTRIWFNNGHGLFSPSQQSYPSSVDIALGDIDNDADLDAILTRRTRGDESSLLIYLNTGDGTLMSDNSVVQSTKLTGVKLLDADLDGNLDMWVGDGLLFMNRGDGKFDTIASERIVGSASLTHTIDIDLDGDIDVWVSKSETASGIRLWLNGEDPEVHSIKFLNHKIVIKYSGILQSSDTPTGPYYDLPDAGIPHIINPDASSRYFRAR